VLKFLLIEKKIFLFLKTAKIFICLGMMCNRMPVEYPGQVFGRLCYHFSAHMSGATVLCSSSKQGKLRWTCSVLCLRAPSAFHPWGQILL